MSEKEAFTLAGRAILNVVEEIDPAIAVSALAAVIVSFNTSCFETEAQALAAMEDLFEDMRSDLTNQFKIIARNGGGLH